MPQTTRMTRSPVAPASVPAAGPRRQALVAAAGSAALLATAFVFQAVGYRPCELCLLQRWPHAVAAAIGVGLLLTGYRRVWSVLGLLAAVAATGFALYHAGVELQWWAGPSACTGGLGNLTNASPADLLNRIHGAQVVRCDQPAWSLLGLSMAGWNALCSAGLSVLWAVSLFSRQGGRAGAGRR